jgi:hypothetical protein
MKPEDGTMREQVKTIAVNCAVIAVIALLLIWAVTWQRQQAQFRRGESALAAGNYMLAIAGFEAAIHMYTPGSSTVKLAAERLWALGEGFEKTGDTTRALLAYRSLRSSFYAVHGLTTPGQDWIARCDTKIASLVQFRAQQKQENNLR